MPHTVLTESPKEKSSSQSSVISNDDGKNGTPVNSQKGLLSLKEGTPRSTPIRNKILDNVREEQLGKSPMLQIPSTPIMERLGYGTGVGVFLLERSPRANCIRSPWAIKKTVKVEASSELFAARIEYEAKILKQLSHPNIIGYRAFGISSPDSAFLAMEKASKSLADLIEDRVNEVLLVDDCDAEAPFAAWKMEKVALDMAKALVYLHDEVKMIHGDLKSANVLVFGDFETAKLCDFGVSRKISKDGTLEGNYVGTEIWNPMEVVKYKNGKESLPITYKADMYPYGLTIHEMITLKPPHLSSAEESYLSEANDTNESEDESSNDSFDEDAYELALSKYVGTRPLLPEIDFDDTYNTILGVFYVCTDEDPSKRPDANVIVSALTANSEKGSN